METNNPHKHSAFDKALWRLYFEQTQEPNLIMLGRISRLYTELRDWPHRIPQELYGNGRLLKFLGETMNAMNESYIDGCEFNGGMFNSLYIELERLRQSKDTEVDEMLQAAEFIADVGTNHRCRNCNSLKTKKQ